MEFCGDGPYDCNGCYGDNDCCKTSGCRQKSQASLCRRCCSSCWSRFLARSTDLKRIRGSVFLMCLGAWINEAHRISFRWNKLLGYRSKPVPYSIPECPQILKEPPLAICMKSHMFPLLWPLIKSFKDQSHSKGKVCDLIHVSGGGSFKSWGKFGMECGTGFDLHKNFISTKWNTMCLMCNQDVGWFSQVSKLCSDEKSFTHNFWQQMCIVCLNHYLKKEVLCGEFFAWNKSKYFYAWERRVSKKFNHLNKKSK